MLQSLLLTGPSGFPRQLQLVTHRAGNAIRGESWVLIIEYLCLLSKHRIMLYQGHGYGEGQHDVTDQDISPRRSQVSKYGAQPVQSIACLLYLPWGFLCRQFTWLTAH